MPDPVTVFSPPTPSPSAPLAAFTPPVLAPASAGAVYAPATPSPSAPSQAFTPPVLDPASAEAVYAPATLSPSVVGGVFDQPPEGKLVLNIALVTNLGGVNGKLIYAGIFNGKPAWSSNGSTVDSATNTTMTWQANGNWRLYRDLYYAATKASSANSPDGLTAWTVGAGGAGNQPTVTSSDEPVGPAAISNPSIANPSSPGGIYTAPALNPSPTEAASIFAPPSGSPSAPSEAFTPPVLAPASAEAVYAPETPSPSAPSEAFTPPVLAPASADGVYTPAMPSPSAPVAVSTIPTVPTAAFAVLDPAGDANAALYTAKTLGSVGEAIRVAYAEPAAQATTTVTVADSTITVTPGTKARMVVGGTSTGDGINPFTLPTLFYIGLYNQKPVYSNVIAGGLAIHYLAWTGMKWSLGPFGSFESFQNVATPDLVTEWIPVGAATGAPTVTAGVSSAAQVIAAVNASIPAAALVTASASGPGTGPVAAVANTALAVVANAALAPASVYTPATPSPSVPAAVSTIPAGPTAAFALLDPAGDDNAILLTARQAGTAGNELVARVESAEVADAWIEDGVIVLGFGWRDRLSVTGGAHANLTGTDWIRETNPDPYGTDFYRNVRDPLALISWAGTRWELSGDGVVIYQSNTNITQFNPTGVYASVPTGSTIQVSVLPSTAAQMAAACNLSSETAPIVLATTPGGGAGGVAAVANTSLSGGSGVPLAAPSPVQP